MALGGAASSPSADTTANARFARGRQARGMARGLKRGAENPPGVTVPQGLLVPIGLGWAGLVCREVGNLLVLTRRAQCRPYFSAHVSGVCRERNHGGSPAVTG
jgi:hypothetical protein